MPGSTSSWVTILVVIFVLRWVALEATFQNAKKKGVQHVFPAALSLRLLIVVAIPLFLYGSVQSLRSADDWWVSIILLGFGVGAILFFPATIKVDSENIIKEPYIGFIVASIKWEDVDYSIPDHESNSIRVVSKSGKTIEHSKFHVDRDLFLQQVKMHTRHFSESGGLG
jgi:hypothetical protein